MFMEVTWLGIASFLIESKGRTAYVDPYFEPYPYVEPELPLADLILVSHFHFDHCTSESVQKVRQDNTQIFGPAEVASRFLGCTAMRAGETRDLGWTKITAMPARMVRGGHEENVLGWWLELEGKTVYFTSDTTFLPGMRKLKPDVLIIPVGGTRTLRAEEAAFITKTLSPKFAIPMHWGRIAGSRDDAEFFKEMVERERKTHVIILEPGEQVTL